MRDHHLAVACTVQDMPCCIQPAVSSHSAIQSAQWLYIQVIQRHKACGGAAIPVAARGLLCAGNPLAGVSMGCLP